MPDVVIENRKDKTCVQIDVAILADRNVTHNKAENKIKYKRLCTEIQRM